MGSLRPGRCPRLLRDGRRRVPGNVFNQRFDDRYFLKCRNKVESTLIHPKLVPRELHSDGRRGGNSGPPTAEDWKRGFTFGVSESMKVPSKKSLSLQAFVD